MRKLFTFFLALVASTTIAWAKNPTGYCGPNLIWTWNSTTHIFTIEGTGAMNNFDPKMFPTPWMSYSENILMIEFPEGMTRVGEYAFASCTGLTDVTVKWTNLSGITTAATAFDNVPIGNVNLHVPTGTYATYAAVEPWKYFKIKDPTYSGTCGENLTWEYDPSTRALTISGTGKMTDYAGYDSKPWHAWRKDITSVVLSEGLTSIGNNSFYGCTALTSITIPDGVITIGKNAFNSCSNLPSIDIPSSVTSIGVAAFANCKVLTSIEIPSGVTAIADNTFNSCWALTSIDIPEGVDTIGVAAFMNCYKALKSITIPANVTEIGAMAFNACTQLADIYVGWTSTPPTPGTDAFKDLDLSNIKLHVPYGTATTYQAAPVWQDFHIVEINPSGTCGENLTWEYDPTTTTLTISGTGAMTDYKIGNAPWHDYRGDITSLILSSDLTHIGNYTFRWFTSLTSVTIPENVTSIGTAAFMNCDNLTTINIPAGVTIIENYVFQNCVSLPSITIPENVTSIGIYAFMNCYNLTTINIPSSVKSISQSAFFKCTSLTSVHIPASVETIGASAFNYTGVISMTVDPGNTHFDSRNDCNAIIETESNKLLFGCENTVIPNTVTAIEKYAFEYRPITTMTIPSSVTNIETGIFYYCNNLTDLYVSWDDPSTLTLSSPFYGLTIENVKLHVPAGTKDIYLAVEPWKNFIIVEETATGLTPYTIHPTPYTNKLLREGQLLILRGDKVYTITGQEVK